MLIGEKPQRRVGDAPDDRFAQLLFLCIIAKHWGGKCCCAGRMSRRRKNFLAWQSAGKKTGQSPFLLRACAKSTGPAAAAAGPA